MPLIPPCRQQHPGWNAHARITFTAGALGLWLLLLCGPTVGAADPGVAYQGSSGPGVGRRIVLISGDEEYRSEEALPQLGKILALRHGFQCTVLFSVAPDSGEIDPRVLDNIPGLAALADADLMIIATRFRNLPDEQMRLIDDYLVSGRPVIGMRTATHAFQIPGDRNYHHYSNGYRGDRTEWHGGFGRLVLGEQWISHHGAHGRQSTRGLLAPGQTDHPILRGVRDGEVWGPTDVYTVRLPLPGDSVPLVLGAVLEGMSPDDHPVAGEVNDPMMPIAWTKSYQLPGGQVGRAFATTLGASQDLLAEGTRRLLVNACYWCLGLAEQIPPQNDVRLVGSYNATAFGFGKHAPGLTPADHRWPVP